MRVNTPRDPCEVATYISIACERTSLYPIIDPIEEHTRQIQFVREQCIKTAAIPRSKELSS